MLTWPLVSSFKRDLFGFNKYFVVVVCFINQIKQFYFIKAESIVIKLFGTILNIEINIE